MAKVLLDLDDVDEKFRKDGLSPANVTFEMLNKNSQKLVEIAGRAILYSWDGNRYNAIYAPINKEIKSEQV